MKISLHHRTNCRLCNSERLELVVPLKASPIADAYISASHLGQKQNVFPLDLYLCRDCGHIQNLDIVDPEMLFRDYLFTTASSAGLVEHFRQYATDVIKNLNVKPDSLVVEIGSNDGTLLRFFEEHGMRVLGIDPAREIAQQAITSGIETLPEFFSTQLAKQICKKYGKASIVCANNVFAHADDLADIVCGIREIIDDGGVFIFESTYLVDLLDDFLFDTVYHEHVSYHSVNPLVHFFDRFGMQLIDVQRNKSKGGSIRGYVQRKPEGNRSVCPIIHELINLEQRRGFDMPQIYRDYAAQIQERKIALNAYLDKEIAAGKMVAGYGASTTTTTLIWQFELTRKLGFLADDNPKKHGLYSPGCHIPVVPSEEIYIRQPDLIVILAWQYAGAIIQRHHTYLNLGGRFIIPLLKLSIVDKDSIVCKKTLFN